MPRIRWLLLALVLTGGAAAPGQVAQTSPYNHWSFTFKNLDGNATFQTSAFTVVFEGIRLGGSTRGAFAVAGPGDRTDASFGSGNYKLKITYFNGVATILFDKHVIKVLNEGRELEVDANRLSLDDQSPTVTVALDGQVLADSEILSGPGRKEAREEP